MTTIAWQMRLHVLYTCMPRIRNVYLDIPTFAIPYFLCTYPLRLLILSMLIAGSTQKFPALSYSVSVE